MSRQVHVANIKGPKGDPGEQGIPGPKGDTGDQGPQGIQGIKGDTGAQGLKGDTGAQGIQGVKGDTGDPGPKGDTGSQGIQGVKGDTGAQGIQGVKGDKGDTGNQGIQGLTGAPGIFERTFTIDGAASVMTGNKRWYNPSSSSLTISLVRVSATTVPVGAALVIDVKKNGTTIFPTTAKPQVAAGSGTGTGTAVPDVVTLAAGDYLTVDIVSVGSSTAGSNITVQIILS